MHKMTDKQWEAMLLVHNTAPFRIIRAASPYMRDAAKDELEKKGAAEPRCIINVKNSFVITAFYESYLMMVFL